MYTQLLSIVNERREMQIYVVFSTTFTLNYNDINEREDRNSNKKNKVYSVSKNSVHKLVFWPCSSVLICWLCYRCRDSNTDYIFQHIQCMYAYILVRIYTVYYIFALMMCLTKFMYKKLPQCGTRQKKERENKHTFYLYQVSKSKQS